MSRRDPRASLNVRQNDALAEFENFKKKFLLANKHITKLNSTLSVRIEELQAEISTLYVENLRLRASEIALATQLKKEQEKSRKVLSDAEAATSNLSKHLTFLRQSLHIPLGNAATTLEPKPPPRVRRPMLDPNTSPQMPRLSRAPNFPGIYEDDEVASSAEADDDDDVDVVHVSSSARRRAKERHVSPLSSSRSPLPHRIVSAPPATMAIPPLHVGLGLMEREPSSSSSSTKRKSSRRQSGLLSVNTDVGVSMTSERLEGPVHPRASSPALGSPERRNAGLAEDDEERQVDEMISSGFGVMEELDYESRAKKKKAKTVERGIIIEDSDFGRTKVRERKRRKEDEGAGLKDVTNSPRSRTVLPPLDTRPSDRNRQCTPETDAPTSAATSVATSRTFLSTPATTPMTTPQASQLPTPRTSSPILLGAASASESEALLPGGRERRVRKSVNYTEPKLNTKMRKPDPVPPAPITTTAPKKRVSSSTTNVLSDDTDGRSSVDGSSRRPVSPLQPPAPRPSTATSASSTSAGGSSSIKRKKSRPFIPVNDDDDDESDGTQADGEYGNGWVNMDGRRRGAQSGAAVRGSNSLRRVLEADDARRHSLAV